MSSPLDPALKVAEFLLQIKAVKLSPKKPFTWASGWKSPIYCDNRKTLSYPAVRTYIRQQFVHIINSEFGRPDMIAGVATGGIAHGALVAHDMGLPFLYVRSGSKDHGMKNQVEGDLTVGRSVVVVEDLDEHRVESAGRERAVARLCDRRVVVRRAALGASGVDLEVALPFPGAAFVLR